MYCHVLSCHFVLCNGLEASPQPLLAQRGGTMGKEGPVVAAQGGSSWAQVPGYIQTPLALSPFLNLARFQLFPFSGLLNGVLSTSTPLHAIPICLLPPAPGWAERSVRDIAVVLAAPMHDKSTGNHKGALSPAMLPSLKGWALSVRALCIFKEQEQLQASPGYPGDPTMPPWGLKPSSGPWSWSLQRAGQTEVCVGELLLKDPAEPGLPPRASWSAVTVIGILVHLHE